MIIEVLSKEQIVKRTRAAPMSVVGILCHRDELIEIAKAMADGYYVTESPEFVGSLPEVIEGPHLDEAYAKHRAQSVHGMAPPTDYVEPEITEDDLPW